MNCLSHLNTIHNTDCVEFMRTMPDDCVDAVIADPPYNLNKNFGNDSDIWNTVEDWLQWSKTWIDESLRILKPTGSIFIYGIHHFTCFTQCYLYEKKMQYRRQFIWYYENGFSTYRNAPAAHYETLLWFSKSNNYTYHPIREAYKSQDRLRHKIIKNGKIWTPHPDGKHAGDVWNFPTLAGKRFQHERTAHPTQKPLSLAHRLTKHFTNEGDSIFIPFAGSGTECVSAAMYNRHFLATELNEEYISIAKERLSNLQYQASATVKNSTASSTQEYLPDDIPTAATLF